MTPIAIESRAPRTDTAKLLVMNKPSVGMHLRRRSDQGTSRDGFPSPYLSNLSAAKKPPLDGRVRNGAAHPSVPQQERQEPQSSAHPLLRLPRQEPDKAHPLLSSRQEPDKAHPLLSSRQEPDKVHPLLSSRPMEGQSKPKSHRRCHSTPMKPTTLPDRNISTEDPINDLIDDLNSCLDMHGEAHPKTGLCRNLIGNHHFRRGGFDAADEAYKLALQCYKLASKNTPKDKLAIAATLGNIGAVCWRTGKVKDAIQSLEEAHSMQVQAVGAAKEGIQNNVDVASTLFNLGMARSLDGDHGNALDALVCAKDIMAARYGPTHAEVARAIDAMGRVHLLKGDADMAIKCHSDALRLKRDILGSRHPSVLQSMTNVAAANRARGDLDEAARMYRDVLNARKVALYRESNQERRRVLAADIGETVRFIGELQKERSKSSEESMDTIVEEKANVAKDDWF